MKVSLKPVDFNKKMATECKEKDSDERNKACPVGNLERLYFNILCLLR
jgi:hypothetical protein